MSDEAFLIFQRWTTEGLTQGTCSQWAGWWTSLMTNTVLLCLAKPNIKKVKTTMNNAARDAGSLISSRSHLWASKQRPREDKPVCTDKSQLITFPKLCNKDPERLHSLIYADIRKYSPDSNSLSFLSHLLFNFHVDSLTRTRHRAEAQILSVPATSS